LIKTVENKSLKTSNTFGLEANARFFCQISEETQLLEAIQFASINAIKYMILGGGSNILFTKDFEGLVIKIENKGIKIIEENAESILLEVAAGENWHELVQYTLAHNWYGMENLSLIPGNVGASPMQNIGAYGVEVMNLIDSVRFYQTETTDWQTLKKEECEFGYRESIFKQELKGKAIIWSVNFRLFKNTTVKLEYGDINSVLQRKGIESPGPLDVSNAVIEIRQSKLPDPGKIGNAGSFFKNPVVEKSIFESIKQNYPSAPAFPIDEKHVKVPAGWLIETAGWKGKRFESYGVHEKQALVLVNYGGSNGNQILQLAKDIQADIQKKFQIELQTEVNII
jgi:UDP-N-acetylmuramate dehydrogenase